MAQNKYLKLQKLESRINKCCTHTETWLETKLGHSLYNRWEKLIIELRGWAESVFELGDHGVTNPEWIDYCEQKGLNWSYTFGDVIA